MSDLIKRKLWTDLVDAADAHHVERTKERAQQLSDAAKAWAASFGASQRPTSGIVRGTNSNTLRTGQTIPFGRSKGVAIEEADTKDLQWVAGALRESIADPGKEKWAPANRRLLDAIEHELETR